MVISIIKFKIDLPPMESIKDRRKIVNSIKDRITKKYRISVSEVGVPESRSFAVIGGAVVSNSHIYGESVLHKVLHFVEEISPGRLFDVEIYSAQS